MVLKVVEYLEACNKLFERGLLGHVRIPTFPNAILSNMEDGYAFFTSWLDSLLKSKEGQWLACKMHYA